MVMDIDMFFTVGLIIGGTILLFSTGVLCLLKESIKKDDNK